MKQWFPILLFILYVIFVGPQVIRKFSVYLILRVVCEMKVCLLVKVGTLLNRMESIKTACQDAFPL